MNETNVSMDISEGEAQGIGFRKMTFLTLREIFVFYFY